MKKLFVWAKSIFTGLIGKAIVNEVEDVVDDAMDKFYEEDHEACIAAVKAAHAAVPLLQRIAAKTSTPIDDNLVEEVRKELEEFAVKHSITL